MRVKQPSWFSCLLLISVACRDHTDPTIQLVSGLGDGQAIAFSPKSTLAEYVELPNQGDQLRIILTNFDSSCETYLATPPDGIMIVLTFVVPAGHNPSAGTYTWPGLPANINSSADLDLKAPIVIPVVRQGTKSITMLPGGNVDIQQVNLERHGEVTGAMRLEQSGGEGLPATRLFGTFNAKLCRTTNQP